MRKEFKDHCKEYNLTYDFTELGEGYANMHTHEAFILYKSLQNTAPNPAYEKCPSGQYCKSWPMQCKTCKRNEYLTDHFA